MTLVTLTPKPASAWWCITDGRFPGPTVIPSLGGARASMRSTFAPRTVNLACMWWQAKNKIGANVTPALLPHSPHRVAVIGNQHGVFGLHRRHQITSALRRWSPDRIRRRKAVFPFYG
ncbi:hypothetical protein KCP69_12600 [Salmonella enterica subsp. enterica]|nr:hypothetical protein KCP69_12600 [Salmonella enterica subsp. enterica]